MTDTGSTRNGSIIEIGPATIEGAMELARDMRECDRQELWASSNSSPADALIAALRVSSESYQARLNGDIVCMWGVGAICLAAGWGSPWLLGTDLIPKIHLTFLRISKHWVAESRMRYAYLENWVDARNEDAVSWLRWLGFQVEDAQPHGVMSLPFHRFHMEGDKNWRRYV